MFKPNVDLKKLRDGKEVRCPECKEEFCEQNTIQKHPIISNVINAECK